MNWECALTKGSQTPVRAKAAIVLDEASSRSGLLSDSFSEDPFENSIASTGLFSAIQSLTVDSFYFANSTPISTERSLRRSTSIRDFSLREPERAIDAALEKRRTLLARKYVAKESFSDESAARLAILNEQMRRLLPAVSSKEVEALESAMAVLADARGVDSELRASLGLD